MTVQTERQTKFPKHENVTIFWDTPENEIGYVRSEMTDLQLEGIFNSARYGVIEASTKSGKTHGCIVWIAEQAILYGAENRNFWWVAPVSDQADIAFRRMKQALPQDKFVANESRKFIKLWNGAYIWFKSADKPDSLYGEDVYACVVDEATRCKDDSWHALRSTLTATKGPVRIIGNVKGRANWMYKIARLAQGGDHPDMHYVKITAYDAAEAGVIEYEEIENAKMIYPELVFRELYLAEPGDDGGNPFGITAIGACIAPMTDNPPVAFGWDVAKYNNYTVGIGLDRQGHTCRFHRFQNNWEETIPKMVAFTQGTPAMIDSTGSGDQLLERLRAQGNTNFTGYVFGGWRSKQDIMLGLAVAIQNREITFPDGPIVDELEAFEYQVVANSDRVLYAAPKGVHDDCVDALAMATALWTRRQRYSGDAVPILLGKQSQWRIG
jgi:hypothetical protein